MLWIHRFLSASAILLLVSCAVARSLNEETLPAMDLMAGSDGDDDPYAYPRPLADLVGLLVAGGHVLPYAQSAGGEKRSWPSGFSVPSSMKRKMFWTPLGHLPASARLGRPRNLRPHLEDAGSPVFRYG